MVSEGRRWFSDGRPSPGGWFRTAGIHVDVIRVAIVPADANIRVNVAAAVNVAASATSRRRARLADRARLTMRMGLKPGVAAVFAPLRVAGAASAIATWGGGTGSSIWRMGGSRKGRQRYRKALEPPTRHRPVGAAARDGYAAYCAKGFSGNLADAGG
jgi:hypothetical protein